MSNLVKRSLSAIILAPIFLYVIYKGGMVFFSVTLLMFGLMFYEWLSLTSKAKHRIYWAVFGLLYLGIAFLAFIFLERMRPIADVMGLQSPPIPLFVILALVWVTDIFAYFFGRVIGGPKLAPKISPNKTWAGAIGGVIGGVMLFFVMNYHAVSSLENIKDSIFYFVFAFHIIVPIISQLGDLFESYMKRRFGVKDSGNIIPGHGGLLDRFDGLLLVLNVVAIYFYISSYQVVMDSLS